jgi:hypothetical protein
VRLAVDQLVVLEGFLDVGARVLVVPGLGVEALDLAAVDGAAHRRHVQPAPGQAAAGVAVAQQRDLL